MRLPVIRDRWLRHVLAGVAALSLAAPGALAQSSGDGLRLIRDAEIEGLMRLYTKPIFKAAGLNPSSLRIYLINDQRVNAFVAGGQRIFIHTGLLADAKTPNEVIGVLAHETAHIAGGHLARMGSEMDKANTVAIVGMLLGAAAMVGGAISGGGESAKAGQGLILGSQGMAQRTLLSYSRDLESTADQAALKYLNATGQSAQGMLTLFQKLANQSIASINRVDPYVLSHPMPFERIRNLETAAAKSPNFKKTDKPELQLRHDLMQAKLAGFLMPAQTVFQRYPTSNKSLPARYARAIAMFRAGDLRNAVKAIDGLIEDLPADPYFFELKGQALLEGGQPAAAVAPLRKASKMLPESGLIKMMLAQALIGTENRADAEAALGLLRAAQKTEGTVPSLYRYKAMAHAKLGDIPRAELATAEVAYLQGDRELAIDKAKGALKGLKRGTPDWLRANDILNFAKKD